jgi:hypothetical protein
MTLYPMTGLERCDEGSLRRAHDLAEGGDVIFTIIFMFLLPFFF